MTGILKVDTIQRNDGSTPTAADLGLNIAGSIIQIQQTKVTSFSTINCADAWASLTSVSITPSSSNSKFIITGHAQIGNPSSGGLEMGIRIRREVNGISSYPCIANASGSTTASTLGNQVTGSNNAYEGWTPAWNVYDAPSSSNTITYHLEYFGSEGQTAYYNRFATSADAAYNVHGTTTLIVMEIAG